MFDVIVIGAGHAGCEAALASSRMGAEDPSSDHESRQGRLHVVQSGGGRPGQGAPRQGGRRPGRADGAHDRRDRHPVPDPQHEKGTGGPGDARAGRQGGLLPGDEEGPGGTAEPASQAGGRRAAYFGRQPGYRRGDRMGRAHRGTVGRADDRHVPERPDPCRLRAKGRREDGGRRVPRSFGKPYPSSASRWAG